MDAILFSVACVCKHTHSKHVFSPYLQEVDVILMEELPIKGKLTPSSNAAMSNSLTDGSTETFWESRDEPRGRPRQLTVTFDKEKEVFGVSVHIDNQKDGGVSQ